MTTRSFSVPRTVVVAVTTLVIFLPIGLIFWQSFLNAPFFNPAHRYGVDAYAFIFEDSDFWNAFLNSVVIAAGMVLIALPLGAALAFLLTRTDLPAQRTIEVLVLIPVFVSPMVLAFGYVVAMGPVGFYSLWAKNLVGDVQAGFSVLWSKSLRLDISVALRTEEFHGQRTPDDICTAALTFSW